MILALFSTATLLTQDTAVFRLAEAAARAVVVSPQVAAAMGAVRRPLGLRAEAWWPFVDNPTIDYSYARRSALGTTHDRQWSVTQEIEIAPQWLWRGRSAAAAVSGAEARVDDTRRLVALGARRAYVTLVIAERRAALTDSAATFAGRLAEFGRRQFDAGEINRLEWNAAALESARARSLADRARAELGTATAELAGILALPSDSVPRTSTLPPIPDLRWSNDTVLVALARSRRPDLRASEAGRLSADRAATAARLSIFPNLTVSGFSGREAGTDRLLGIAVGLRFPLFYRRQAGLGAALADRIAAESELTATQRSLRADVLSAAVRFQRARAAERRFAADVVRAATENVTLTERALAEGEVSLTDVLVLRATAVSAQVEYLDVLRDATGAWFELAAALATDPDSLPALLGTGN